MLLMPSRAIDQYCGGRGRMWPSWPRCPIGFVCRAVTSELKSNSQARRAVATAQTRAIGPRMRSDATRLDSTRHPHSRHIRSETFDRVRAPSRPRSLVLSRVFRISKIYIAILSIHPAFDIIADFASAYNVSKSVCQIW